MFLPCEKALLNWRKALFVSYPTPEDYFGFHFSSGVSFSISAAAAAAKLLQPCPTLCDPIDGNPPGSSIPGILQARTLEWVAISSSNA